MRFEWVATLEIIGMTWSVESRNFHWTEFGFRLPLFYYKFSHNYWMIKVKFQEREDAVILKEKRAGGRDGSAAWKFFLHKTFLLHKWWRPPLKRSPLPYTDSLTRQRDRYRTAGKSFWGSQLPRESGCFNQKLKGQILLSSYSRTRDGVKESTEPPYFQSCLSSDGKDNKVAE